jgi:hypothetical protein
MTKTTYIVEIHIHWDFAFAPWTYRREVSTLKEAYELKKDFYNLPNQNIIEFYVNYHDNNDKLLTIYRKYGFWPTERIVIGDIFVKTVEENVLTDEQIKDII